MHHILFGKICFTNPGHADAKQGRVKKAVCMFVTKGAGQRPEGCRFGYHGLFIG